MTDTNDFNNAKYLKYRTKFFISEFFGTALLLLGGLSLVIFMFGSGSPMALLIPAVKVRQVITGFLFRINRRINRLVAHRKGKRGAYQSRRYNGVLVVSQD